MIRIAQRFFVFISVLFGVLAVSGLAISAIDRAKKNETYKELEIFADALAFVQAQYVDEADPKDLIYGAMAGMLANLDPHSQFLTPEEYDELKVDTEGKFGGIGIEITLRDDLVTIITPIEGTPAWEAGIQPNDRIVKIDDTVIRDLTLNEAVKMLRGKPGTEVMVLIWREKEGRLHAYKIKRAVIDVQDIKEAKVLEDGIGHLKIVEFRDGTPQELDRVLKDLKSQGMEALILDMRNNPGGLLDKGVEVAERFLPKGALVVSIKGRDEKGNFDFKAGLRDPDVSIPMVVLINEGSASGSEIVAGALQDHKRAVILGTTSFGKGSVQTVLPLRDGSALKLTTSRYLTPSGRSIQDTGIFPDIEVEGPQRPAALPAKPSDEEELEKIFESFVPEKEIDQKRKELEALYAQDPPLARAVDLLKSIRVYRSFLEAHPVKTSR